MVGDVKVSDDCCCDGEISLNAILTVAKATVSGQPSVVSGLRSIAEITSPATPRQPD